jgi:hypothetical protein
VLDAQREVERKPFDGDAAAAALELGGGASGGDRFGELPIEHADCALEKQGPRDHG